MSDKMRDQSLAALRWLVDAGADEAIAEIPANRFAQSVSTPLPQVSATAARPAAANPRSPGVTPIAKPETRAPSQAQAVSLATAPGAARALAQACTTLAELKAAVTSFNGCDLKRYATNTVFADGN